MNHNNVAKYIKSHFKNMLEDKIKSIEQSIRSNIKKQYKLKNPILSEYCIINSIEEFNRLLAAENKEYMNEIDDIGEIVPIRIEKIDNLIGEDDEYKQLPTTDAKIKIISIEKNCYCRYILNEI